MKQLIAIGEGCWFIDSFEYFIDKGFDITVIKTQNKLKWFYKNYDILSELGAKVLEYENSADFLKKLNLSPETIVLCGGNFCGDVDSFFEFKDIGLEELDILYSISKFNHDNQLGAQIIRYFNGDTCWGTQENVDIFNKKIKYVDTLIFDNDLLKEFVMSNIPEAKNKKALLGWIETPLKKYVKHNQSKEYSKEFISIGRILCSKPLYRSIFEQTIFYPNPHKKFKGVKKLLYKIHNYLIKRRKSSYSLAGQNSLSTLRHDREIFYATHKEICFGLSHFYDIFRGSISSFKKNKDLFFSLTGQSLCSNILAAKEAFYAFTNNPSKDIGYLMNGIIPIISHAEHNVYKEMVKRKMAILVETQDDILAVLKMSDKEIQEYRDNIYANRDLYTFDHVGEMIINQLDEG